MATDKQEQNDRTQIAVIQSQLKNIQEVRLPAIDDGQKEILRKIDAFTFVPMAVHDRDIEEIKKMIASKSDKVDTDNVKKLVYAFMTGVIGFFFYIIQLRANH